jgi:hypothetical protein
MYIRVCVCVCVRVRVCTNHTGKAMVNEKAEALVQSAQTQIERRASLGDRESSGGASGGHCDAIIPFALRAGHKGGGLSQHAEAFYSALGAQPIDLYNLKRAGFFGVPDDAAHLRSSYWKLALRFIFFLECPTTRR